MTPSLSLLTLACGANSGSQIGSSFLVKQLFLHNPFLNLSVRLHYRSMQLCWHWTHSRSSTADFPTLGKYIIFSSDCGAPVFPFYHTQRIISWLCCECVKLLRCDIQSCEQFYFDAVRCLQDAEVLLTLTEEVNATLKNKVSLCFSLFFITLTLFFSLDHQRFVHVLKNVFVFPSSSLPGSSKCWDGSLSVKDGDRDSPSTGSSCRRLS